MCSIRNQNSVPTTQHILPPQSCSFPLHGMWSNFPHLLLTQWIWDSVTFTLILRFLPNLFQEGGKKIETMIRSQTLFLLKGFLVLCETQVKLGSRGKRWATTWGPESWHPKNALDEPGSSVSGENMKSLQDKRRKKKKAKGSFCSLCAG